MQQLPPSEHHRNDAHDNNLNSNYLMPEFELAKGLLIERTDKSCALTLVIHPGSQRQQIIDLPDQAALEAFISKQAVEHEILLWEIERVSMTESEATHWLTHDVSISDRTGFSGFNSNKTFSTDYYYCNYYFDKQPAEVIRVKSFESMLTRISRHYGRVFAVKSIDQRLNDEHSIHDAQTTTADQFSVRYFYNEAGWLFNNIIEVPNRAKAIELKETALLQKRRWFFGLSSAAFIMPWALSGLRAGDADTIQPLPSNKRDVSLHDDLLPTPTLPIEHSVTDTSSIQNYFLSLANTVGSYLINPLRSTNERRAALSDPSSINLNVRNSLQRHTRSLLSIPPTAADGPQNDTCVFPAVIQLSDLDGTNGFVLQGVAGDDRSGGSVSSAGDINGDGLDDLIIGARLADPGGQSDAGESYVVFGSMSSFNGTLPLSNLDGTNGFVLQGVVGGDRSGFSVSSVGDINADGIDDLIIGAPYADPGGRSLAGESYVVFGSTSPFGAALPLSALDGTNGFVLQGVVASDYSGWSVSNAGDVNGDGIDDLIIGARFADSGGRNAAGESYVVFGSTSAFSAVLPLSDLDGTNGFVLQGVAASDYSGISVSSAGDINGDGLDDLIIGAYGADPGGRSLAGESYVVFGSTSGFNATLPLSDLDGTNGFRLPGVAADDYSGASISSAGDINGDGLDDLIIGAWSADPGERSLAGESYVVFGCGNVTSTSSTGIPSTTAASSSTTTSTTTTTSTSTTSSSATTAATTASNSTTSSSGTTSMAATSSSSTTALSDTTTTPMPTLVSNDPNQSSLLLILLSTFGGLLAATCLAVGMILARRHHQRHRLAAESDDTLILEETGTNVTVEMNPLNSSRDPYAFEGLIPTLKNLQHYFDSMQHYIIDQFHESNPGITTIDDVQLVMLIASVKGPYQKAYTETVLRNNKSNTQQSNARPLPLVKETITQHIQDLLMRVNRQLY